MEFLWNIFFIRIYDFELVYRALPEWAFKVEFWLQKYCFPKGFLGFENYEWFYSKFWSSECTHMIDQ